MIVGIALVVHEPKKGQRLAFRYPESVPSFVLNSSESLLRFHNEYLSLTPDQFAKIFRPKSSLFNRPLEIIIGDLHYISYPMNCLDEQQAYQVEAINDPDKNTITMFNVVVTMVKENSLRRVQQISNINFDKLSKKAGVNPLAILRGLYDNYARVDLCSIKRVVENFSKALLFQEKRSFYVSKEVNMMLLVLEQRLSRGKLLKIGYRVKKYLTMHLFKRVSSRWRKSAV